MFLFDHAIWIWRYGRRPPEIHVPKNGNTCIDLASNLDTTTTVCTDNNSPSLIKRRSCVHLLCCFNTQGLIRIEAHRSCPSTVVVYWRGHIRVLLLHAVDVLQSVCPGTVYHHVQTIFILPHNTPRFIHRYPLGTWWRHNCHFYPRISLAKRPVEQIIPV